MQPYGPRHGPRPYPQAGGPPRHGYPVYPYAQPRAPYDPRYVGPAWAAPGPPRPLPPKKSGSGCLLALGIFGMLVALFVLMIVVVAVSSSASDGSDDEPVDLPDQRAVLPGDKPLVFKADSTTNAAWAGGTCADFSKERDRSDYYATRNRGSARALKGRVAMVHLQITSNSLKWTKNGQLNVTRAGYMSQRFVLAQAARYQVTGLTFDVIPWSLTTTFDLPPLSTNANNKLSDATMREIRDSSRYAVEVALGTHLESIVAALKRQGYDQVGFVIYFPTKTTARDFAFSAYRSDPDDEAETAFLFAPPTDFPHFAVTVAHEGLHLFGADDLYRLEHIDGTDVHDVMGEYCTGFKQVTIHDATAYAIGWRDAAPARPYGFTLK